MPHKGSSARPRAVGVHSEAVCAQGGSIPPVCFLTSAPLPPGVPRLPAPAAASSIFSFCPNVASTTRFVCRQLPLSTRDRSRSGVTRALPSSGKSSCPVSPGQRPSPRLQAPQRFTWPPTARPPIPAFTKGVGGTGPISKIRRGGADTPTEAPALPAAKPGTRPRALS